MAPSSVVGLALLVLAAVLSTSQGQVSCPPSFVAIGYHCYHFSESMFTWAEGRTYCQGLVDPAEGTADLAVFEAHYADFSNVVDYMETENIRSTFWMGLTDEATETEWVWLDGRVLSLSSVMWACLTPEVNPTSNCAALFTNTAHSLPVGRIQLREQSCFASDFHCLCKFTEV